jgi:chorismate mutase / prephenate dehydratase
VTYYAGKMGLSVAYPGRDGAHAAAAAERLFGELAEIAPLPTFSAVAAAAAAADVDFGVLPIESSLSGPVAETHDLLYSSPLSINAETILPIRHWLVGPALVDLAEVRVVHSHPAALDQCRRLLAAMPWATAVAAPSTADAASSVARKGDPSEAAIASERAAKLNGLEVIAGDVGDHPEAYTRFVAVAPHTRVDGGGAGWRTAFSFVTDHRPGALYRAIEPFAQLGIDLAQLVSRPIPQTPWRYRFDGVLIGHPLDDVVRRGLAELRARTRLVHVSGTYPAAD